MLALPQGGAPRQAARFHPEGPQGAEDADAASALSPLPARQAAPSPSLRRGTAIRYKISLPRSAFSCRFADLLEPLAVSMATTLSIWQDGVTS